jgi:calcineurin-like phosphoesterase
MGQFSRVLIDDVLSEGIASLASNRNTHMSMSTNTHTHTPEKLARILNCGTGFQP